MNQHRPVFFGDFCILCILLCCITSLAHLLSFCPPQNEAPFPSIPYPSCLSESIHRVLMWELHFEFVLHKIIYKDIPVVPARGGAEVALKIYIRPFSSIELACAVRQPSPCVRALCESGVLFHMSHLKLHFALHASHSTLHTPHSTLHTARFPLHTPHFTLHTSHSTLHTSQSTLHTSHSTLHTSHSTLHTSHSTLHTSHPTLHSSHFISSELFSPYPSSSLLISSLLICHLSFHESLPSTTTKELACAVRQPGPCLRALCEAVAVLLSKNMTCARPR